MKVTKETINGKPYTVIWHREGFADKTVTEQNGVITDYCVRGSHLATALPALPRRPKPENARLLYRYASEGLNVVLCNDGTDYQFMGCSRTGYMWGFDNVCSEIEWVNGEEIPHCITESGERVDVAITDGESDEWNY